MFLVILCRRKLHYSFVGIAVHFLYIASFLFCVNLNLFSITGHSANDVGVSLHPWHPGPRWCVGEKTRRYCVVLCVCIRKIATYFIVVTSQLSSPLIFIFLSFPLTYSVLSETLDEWLVCQRTWMYLENIFGAEDIQKQLPAESQKFLVVDRGEWGMFLLNVCVFLWFVIYL